MIVNEGVDLWRNCNYFFVIVQPAGWAAIPPESRFANVISIFISLGWTPQLAIVISMIGAPIENPIIHNERKFTWFDWTGIAFQNLTVRVRFGSCPIKANQACYHYQHRPHRLRLFGQQNQCKCLLLKLTGLDSWENCQSLRTAQWEINTTPLRALTATIHQFLIVIEQVFSQFSGQCIFLCTFWRQCLRFIKKVGRSWYQTSSQEGSFLFKWSVK